MVIEHAVVEGRSVRVVPVDHALRPVAPREATLLKVIFEDDGDVRYYATGRNWCRRGTPPAGDAV
jgi:hypothetical protein